MFPPLRWYGMPRRVDYCLLYTLISSGLRFPSSNALRPQTRGTLDADVKVDFGSSGASGPLPRGRALLHGRMGGGRGEYSMTLRSFVRDCRLLPAYRKRIMSDKTSRIRMLPISPPHGTK